MAFKIVWTSKALNSIAKVVDYLESEWSEKVADEFIANIHRHVALLSSGVLKGNPTSNRPEVKSILITKHNRLYFREKNDLLQMLLLWDNRKNPAKNPYK